MRLHQVGNPRLILTLYDWTFFYFILDSILKSYLKTCKFDDELFNELYCDLESFLYNEQIPLIIIAPLHNFKSHSSASDLDPINLDEGLLVRKITEDERKLLWKNGSDLFPSFLMSSPLSTILSCLLENHSS